MKISSNFIDYIYHYQEIKIWDLKINI
jgi:hypothetical protein